MKKLKLFFACLLMAVLSIGQVWGAAASYTITFGTGSGDGTSADTEVACSTIVSDGSDYLSGNLVTATNVYYNGSNGLKLGASKGKAGSIKMNLSTAGQVTPTSIVVNAKLYNPSKAVTLSVNGSETQSLASDFNNYTYDITSAITYIQIDCSQYCWISSITVNYNSGGSSEPTLSLNPTSKEFNASGNSAQTIGLTANNFSSTVNSVTCAFFNAAACESENAIERPEWVNAPVVNDGKTQVSVNVSDNTGAARSTWMKITAGDGSKTASAIFAISQKAYVVDYATLPFDFTGGSADIPETNGMTQEGLGSDYTSGNPTTKLKFDGDGDWLIIKINAAPGTLSYDIKGNSISGGSIFTVQESADGILYSDLATYDVDGNGIEHTLASSTRYIKFVYTDKVNGNIGLGNIHISEYVAPAAVATPEISGTDNFLTSTEITITCATDGAAIYYTTDDSKKDNKSTETWTLYNSADKPSISETKTIWAAAYKESTWSSVAEVTFNKQEPDYTTIAAFKVDQPSSKKWIQFTAESNVVITGVNGKNVYVQDGNGNAICLYFANTNRCGSWTKAHKVTGMFQATYATYGNMPEMSIADGDENDLEAGTAASMPVATEISTLAEATINANMCKYVKLKGVYFQDQELDGNKTVDIVDAGTNSLKFYDNLEMTKNGLTEYFDLPLTASSCNVYGVLISYKPKSAPAVNEILPIEAACIEAGVATLPTLSAANPSINPAEPTMVSHGSSVTVSPAEGFTCTLNSNALTSNTNVSITGTENNTEIAVTSNRHYYTPASATYYFKANQPETPTFTITVNQVSGGVMAADYAEAEAGTTITLTATPNNLQHITFDGWAVTYTDGGSVQHNVEVTNNQFSMPSYNVTVTGSFISDPTATLTFAKGEATATEDDPVNITNYVGETIQLPANPFTYSGHKFIGWSCDGGATKLAAGTEYQLAENKDFVAYWAAIPTFNDADHEWRLATSLEAGKYYVIGSASQDKTASKTITSGYMSEIDSEIEDCVIAYDALGENTAIFVLGGNSTDGWTLTEVTTDNVLGTTANKNVSWNAGTQVWAISIAEGGNATIGGTSRILHNAANTGKRFTTYNSDLSASMLLPQLYVWTEKAFKLRYDANGGTNAPTATPAAAGKATVTDEQPTAPTGKIFDGWNENELGTGENYVAGDEIAITTADITIYAKWRDPYTFTVSYDANEGEGTMDADADQEEGSIYTIKPNEFTREGYGFAGWKAYDALDNELTITNGKFYIPTSNVTVKAQWNEIVTTNFVLVGNANQLKAGDKVYIVAAASNNAMGAQDNVNYRSRVEIGKTADKGHILITGSTPVELTIGKDGNNFTFYDGTGYLCATSSGNNYMGTQIDLDDNGKWSITINGDGEATIVAQGTNARNYMKYNYTSGQERFTCYASTNTTAGKVAIYKKASAEVIRGELSNGKWGTICPKQTVENATGAMFYQISYLEEQGGVPYNMVFDPISGTTLTAGKPYFFIADGEEITGVKVGVELSEADDAGVNGFYGYIGDGVKALSWKTDYVAGEDNTFVIYDNSVMRLNSATNLKSERCYININATEPTRDDPAALGAAPRRRITMSVTGTNVATDIDALNASETPVKMIIDGKLFILRGEKLYDATGRLVK